MTGWMHLVEVLILGATILLSVIIAVGIVIVVEAMVQTDQSPRSLHPLRGFLILGAGGLLAGVTDSLEANAATTGAIGPPTADPLAVGIYWIVPVANAIQLPVLAIGVFILVAGFYRLQSEGATEGRHRPRPIHHPPQE